MEENNTNLEQQNGGGENNGADNAEKNTPSFDDILKNKEYQSEFDRRMTKAIKTAEEKWQKDAEEKISEAKRLEKMNAEQKAEYQRKQAEEKLAKRESEVTKRELMAEAKAQLLQLLFTVLFRSLRRVAPQRCPVWTASSVWSEFWRLLRLHGYFFIPNYFSKIEHPILYIFF